MGPRRLLPEGEGPLSGSRGSRGGAGRQKASRGGPARSTRTGGRGVAKGVKAGGRAGGAGRRRESGAAAPADLPTPPETLFLATIPGATPSTWVQRFSSRERTVQLVNHDESAQTAHLAHDDAGMPLHPLPQLGYLRWPRGEDGASAVLRAAGLDPRHVHVVTAYSELPVVCVGKEHLLAAWDVDAEGPVPVSELDPAEHMDPARFTPTPDDAFVRETVGYEDASVRETAAEPVPPAPNPLDAPEIPGAGERMALEIVASGVGHVVLPMSVARVFGRKDVVVLPLACELDEVVGLSRADREAAATEAEVQAETGLGVAGAEDDAGRAPQDDDAPRHPGWDVGLAWLKESDSDLVQAFVGVARGRRGTSSR